MGKLLSFRFDHFRNYFSMMLVDRGREPTAHDDETYEFCLHLIRSLRTGEIKGFSNDGGDLAQDYQRLMELLVAHPVPGRYDVPDLGLTDAALPEIITAIYEQHVVGREGEFAYPVAGERIPALQVAERPDDKDESTD
ncbi:MAG: hypothetical protein SXV54_10630 [Chloroflexota bacterium]|nr:hypothetical protein [Chloroflexota bacterium]